MKVFTKESLNKLKKAELIDLVLVLSKKSLSPRQQNLESFLDNGHIKWKRFLVKVSINNNILTINTIYLTPSGYGDNGQRDNVEKILNQNQLEYLENHTIKDFMIKYFNFKENVKINQLPYSN